MQPFFGDLHVHTRYSLDASTQGTRTTPEQAYLFAQGEKIDIQPWTSNGKSVRSMQLRRPLDFAMVSDHAELFGEVHMCNTPERGRLPVVAVHGVSELVLGRVLPVQLYVLDASGSSWAVR